MGDSGLITKLLGGIAKLGCGVLTSVMPVVAWAQGGTARINLPSSKSVEVVPGEPQRVNSLPMSMAVSLDKRYVVTVNAGYGTAESGYQQSLAVMDTRTGKVMDFP